MQLEAEKQKVEEVQKELEAGRGGCQWVSNCFLLTARCPAGCNVAVTAASAPCML